MRIVTVLAFLLLAAPAVACGFGEAPGDCGQTAELDARDMLRRVVTAVRTDEGTALRQFSRGENGFRTVENYVFCVGPDGVMSAHPNAQLQGTDVRELHDSTGNHFIATMMATAKPGQIASIRYLFPRPGETRELPKTTFYTRAGDQVCGVGAYDEASAPGATAPAPPSPSPASRVTALRARLSAEMPPALASDWAALQAALDAEAAARATAFAALRDQVAAAEPAIIAGR